MDRANDTGTGKDADWTDTAEQAIGDFVRGAFHSTVEGPTNGVVQLANLGVIPLTGQKISRLNVTNIEEDLQNGKANLVAVEAGGAIGSAALFYAANKFGMGGKQTMGAVKMAEYGGLNTLKTSLLTSARSGATSGVVWGAVFTESRGGDDPLNVLIGRAENGVQFGLAFGASATAAEGSRYALSQTRLLGTASQTRFLTRELPLAVTAGGVSGAGTGIINANLESLIHEHRLANGGEMGHRALSDGLLGMSFAAAHQTHSHYTKFGPMQPGEPGRLKWIEKTDLKDPALQKFYQENQISALRQPFNALSEESKSFNGNYSMTRDTVAHVTKFPNGRIAAASIDQQIINSKRMPTQMEIDRQVIIPKEKSVFVGQDIFAPELAGTKVPFGHINLLNARLRNSILDGRATGGPAPDDFLGRVIVRPTGPRDSGDTPSPIDSDIRQAYGNSYGRHLNTRDFPMKIQFGASKPGEVPPDAELILTSLEHDMLPPSKVTWREGQSLFRAVKQAAHEVPQDDPQFLADRSAFDKEWKYHDEVRTLEIRAQKPIEPTRTRLQDFHNSPYSEILSRANYGFASGITFDANAEHQRLKAEHE